MFLKIEIMNLKSEVFKKVSYLPAMFIVLEGIDGTGKTTIATKLTEEISGLGYEVYLTQEPTRTWLGKDVRRAIEEEKNGFTQALLFFADRADHIEELRRNADKIIICDRYVYSTFAYQGVQLQESMPLSDAIEWFEGIYEPMRFDPDIVILITVDPKEGLSRIHDRERKEKFEKIEFLNAVQNAFMYLAERYNFVVVDGNRNMDEVYSEVRQIIMEKLKSR